MFEQINPGFDRECFVQAVKLLKKLARTAAVDGPKQSKQISHPPNLLAEA